MPKGVEHFNGHDFWSNPPLVSSSVMPKGVEHMGAGQLAAAVWRVEFSDAERR